MAKKFKTYDTRIEPGDLTPEIIDRVCEAHIVYLQDQGADELIIGSDMRQTSPLFKYLLSGRAIDGGINVTLIEGNGFDKCSTPFFNYVCSCLPEKAGIMVTASHNPGGYNGLKMNAPGCRAIGYSNGLNRVERAYEDRRQQKAWPVKGKLTSVYPLDGYVEETCGLAGLEKKAFDGVKIAFDCANSMGTIDARHFFDFLGANVKYIGDWLDGSFPLHESNPMKPENMKLLSSLVRSREHGPFVCGATGDGDYDRIGMVDERGNILQAHNIATLVVHDIMRKKPEGKDFGVVYTTTMGRSFRDAIEKYGGEGHRVSVGRVFVIDKGIQLMEKGIKVIVGAEGSNHIMFPDKRNMFYENTLLATGHVISYCLSSEKELSDCVKDTNKYCFLGERNFGILEVDKERLFENIVESYKGFIDGVLEVEDGMLVEDKEKGEWFSLRTSNTEPIVRLNVEAASERRMKQMTDLLEQRMLEFGGTRA